MQSAGETTAGRFLGAYVRQATLTLMAAMALVWAGVQAARAELVDPTPYNAALRSAVRDDRVDYAALSRRRGGLDRYLAALAKARPKAGSQAQQMALWINAYNAGTLKLLLDYYPIQRTSFLGYLHPTNSIRQISDAWDREQVEVGATRQTLNQIAHEILRKDFQDPRVLFALASGARGSPALASHAYTGKHLERQLESAVRAFLDDPSRGFRLDRKARRVWLSRLFLWYGKDFVPAHAKGPLAGARSFSETEAAVLHFVRARRPAAEQAILDSGDFSLRYLDYDWLLNGQ